MENVFHRGAIQEDWELPDAKEKPKIFQIQMKASLLLGS